ncbi:MAG TPA: amidohydrolase family protein [Vicinamibacteria bacterium]|nr:amidohydrolase family protein [Vicinamibacteria bacterium]
MGKAIVSALAVIVASVCWSQENPVAIRGATILTGSGAVIEAGTVVFAGGKITDLGGEVAPPAGADVIDGKGFYVTPGFIDAYSHFGLGFSTRSDRESLMAASRRIADVLEIPPDSEWLRSGVTTTYVSPSGQNLIGGMGAVVKLTGVILRGEGGVSASFGETALEAFEAPTTRQGMIGVLRQTLVRAQEDAIEGDEGRVLARMLAGELPVRLLANAPDDILTAIRLAGEFDWKLVLDSAAGAHRVAREIAAAGVSVVVGPSIIGIGDGGSYETFAHTPANAAWLHEAGVRIAFGTASAGGRSVAMEAVVAKAHGLPEEAALRAVTSDAAAILGIDDRVGTLAFGMDADIVLWRNHPISTWAETVRVIVNGETVFER